MKKIECESWVDFEKKLSGYFGLSHEVRKRYWFRGHSTRSWKLTPSIDRDLKVPKHTRHWGSDDERNSHNEKLLDAFSSRAIRSGIAVDMPKGDALELLARHHGLPSPILDWTESPYVAAFFAYDGSWAQQSEYCSVFVFDRSKLSSTADEHIELIHDIELLRFNPRACEQQAVFMRVRSATAGLEELLADALWKYEIKLSDTSIAIACLEAMGMTASRLLPGFDGVARSAMSDIGYN